MGPICSFDETEWNSARPKSYKRETESLQSHLGETEIPIGETEVIWFSGSGYVKSTPWRRIDQIDGAEFDFRFRTYVEMRKWLRVFGAYH